MLHFQWFYFFEEKFGEVQTKYDEIFVEASELKKNVEKKQIELATIEKFFGERENDFQRYKYSLFSLFQIIGSQIGMSMKY